MRIDTQKLTETDTMLLYAVQIVENDNTYSYTVEMDTGDYKRLTDDNCAPEELLKHSFAFLLEREQPEEIRKEFNLMDIADYFPDYEIKMQQNAGIIPE